MRFGMSGACTGTSIGNQNPCFLGASRTRLLPVKKNLTGGRWLWFPVARGSWSQPRGRGGGSVPHQPTPLPFD